MLHLALAETTRDVEKACASAITGAYDLNRHMYFRRTFVSVHVRKDDGTIVDDHKHFIEGGGWSEHAVFVKYLRSEKKADAHPVRRGPGNSGAAKGKKVRHPAKALSPEVRAMLRAPAMEEPEAPGLDIEPDADDSEEEVEVIRVMPEGGCCLARAVVRTSAFRQVFVNSTRRCAMVSGVGIVGCFSPQMER